MVGVQGEASVRRWGVAGGGRSVVGQQPQRRPCAGLFSLWFATVFDWEARAHGCQSAWLGHGVYGDGSTVSGPVRSEWAAAAGGGSTIGEGGIRDTLPSLGCAIYRTVLYIVHTHLLSLVF